jgi:hypothetical protein
VLPLGPRQMGILRELACLLEAHDVGARPVIDEHERGEQQVAPVVQAVMRGIELRLQVLRRVGQAGALAQPRCADSLLGGSSHAFRLGRLRRLGCLGFVRLLGRRGFAGSARRLRLHLCRRRRRDARLQRWGRLGRLRAMLGIAGRRRGRLLPVRRLRRPGRRVAGGNQGALLIVHLVELRPQRVDGAHDGLPIGDVAVDDEHAHEHAQRVDARAPEGAALERARLARDAAREAHAAGRRRAYHGDEAIEHAERCGGEAGGAAVGARTQHLCRIMQQSVVDFR